MWPSPAEGEDQSTPALSISLTFPFFIANVDSVLEAMRLLHWLCRLRLVGHYRVQEHRIWVDYA